LRLFEHESKRIFKDSGIPVPNGLPIKCLDDLPSTVEKIGLPVAVKAQLPVGGRAKARGIRFANTLEEALSETRSLIDEMIGGHRVKSVLIEEKIVARDEYYLGITIDQLSGVPILMFSTRGGVDVNEIAKENPEILISRKTNISRGLFQFEVLDICRSLGLKGTLLLKVSRILHKLYEVFVRCDAVLAEINPLLITDEGEPCAVDAALDIDDNALFRHSDVELDLEMRFQDEIRIDAARSGLSYVRLDGDIGVIGSGAGLTMATADLVKDFGGRPANFLETGGGITEELMDRAVELVLRDERIRALFINLYGGINPMPSAAKGILRALEKLRPGIPILVKLVGNQQEEAWGILERAGVPVVRDIQTEKAVAKLMNLYEEYMCASL